MSDKPKKKVTKKKAVSKKQTKTKNLLIPTVIEELKDDPANDVYFTKQFEVYAVWKSLPVLFLGLTSLELKEKHGLDEPDIVELCEIRNQNMFAERFNLHITTLTRWNKKLKDRDGMADIRVWANTLRKNVVTATYKAATSKSPKAHQDRKLFLEITDGYEQKISLKESLTDVFKKGLGIE